MHPAAAAYQPPAIEHRPCTTHRDVDGIAGSARRLPTGWEA